MNSLPPNNIMSQLDGFAGGDFPAGRWAARWQFGPCLQGDCLRGRYRCRTAPSADGAVVEGLATISVPQTLPQVDLRASLALDEVEGVSPLLDLVSFDDGDPYDVLVEALPPGQPSHEVRLRPGDIKPLAMALIETLGRAHARGLSVFGVRPELVYVKPQGEAWVFSGLVPRAERFISTARPLSRGARPLFPTPYLAPELITHPSGGATPASDIFALCLTLWRWMTGAYPYEGATAFDVVMAITQGTRRRWGKPWRTAERAVAAGLHLDPSRRPVAAQLATMLRRARP